MTQPRKRGFALMDPQRVREIAAIGGRAAHEQGRAHEFTSAEAKAAQAKRKLFRGRGSKPITGE